MPLLERIALSTLDWVPNPVMRRLAGRYRLGSTTLIVTSGIGYSIAPFRYASPSSIEMIDLHL